MLKFIKALNLVLEILLKQSILLISKCDSTDVGDSERIEIKAHQKDYGNKLMKSKDYDDAEDSAINKGEIILYLPNEHGNRLRKVTAYVTISSDESASEAVMK